MMTFGLAYQEPKLFLESNLLAFIGIHGEIGSSRLVFQTTILVNSFCGYFAVDVTKAIALSARGVAT